MHGQVVFVSRLVRLPLLDADGVPIGRVDDVVIGPRGANRAPVAVGFVVGVQRRQIFVNANRVVEIDVSGVRLRSNAVDLRRFRLRPGELLGRADLFGRSVDGAVIADVSLTQPDGERGWHVGSLLLGPGRGLLRRRRAGRLEPWSAHPDLWAAPQLGATMEDWWELHPADLAATVARLPGERRRRVIELLDDEGLAEMLAELPDATAGELLDGLGVERAAHVLEEMDADDAADVLGELPLRSREEVLATMDPDEAVALRRLLGYGRDTVGGLMNPAPVILAPDATVAEALARIRDPDVLAAEAAQVFVVEPPLVTPTGRYLGQVSFQRLLREAPGAALGRCVGAGPAPATAELSGVEVARRLAAYDALALPVCDQHGRLLGAVTVDDVLDRTLPEGWRSSLR